MKYLPGVLALLIAGSAVAQDGSAKVGYDKLVKEIAAANQAYSDQMKAIRESEEYKELAKRFDAANKVYLARRMAITNTEEYKELEKKASARDASARSKMRKLRDTAKRPAAADEARREMRELTATVKRPRPSDWAVKFKAGAEEYAGTDGAVPFLVWLVSRGGPDHAGDALDTIVVKHSASAHVADLLGSFRSIGRIVGRGKVRVAATAIIENNPNKQIKAEAYYGRAMNWGKLQGRTAVLTDEEKVKKAADIAACIKADPESIGALRANAPTFVKERLQIGMVAPDIEGEDFDSVSFKLSDYRGKVVVLDFWGDW